MKYRLIEVTSKINEIFERNSSLNVRLRELCKLMTDFFDDPQKISTYIRLDRNEYFCKGGIQSYRLASVKIKTPEGHTGIFEILSSDPPDKIFNDEEHKREFKTVIQYVQDAFDGKKSKTTDHEKFNTDDFRISLYSKIEEHHLKDFNYKNFYERDTFHDLMKFKVKEILLIATLYDAFTIESEGNFTQQILGEYAKLNLPSVPRITAVTSYHEAYTKLLTKHFDLIIIMVGIDKESPVKIARKLKRDFSYVPTFLLLNNNLDISFFEKYKTDEGFIDQIFVWNGDTRIFVTMIKLLEDMVNAENDTKVGNTRIILLVEDSARYYSRYLPLLYINIFKQTQRIIEEVVAKDELYKILSLRMRPKVLLASSFEEAKAIFDKYDKYFLSLITDVRFYKNGEKDENAGFELAQYIKEKKKERPIPIIVQSSNLDNKKRAEENGFVFIYKNSDTLARDINHVIKFHMGFGDFIYCHPDGTPTGFVAHNMDEFEELLAVIPEETLIYHAERNHFSLWLMARGEIHVAEILATIKIDDFYDVEELRKFLIETVKKIKYEKNKGKIVDFIESELGNPSTIVSLDSGALGGKGRGIAFIQTLVYRYDIRGFFPDIKIKTPTTAIIGTDQYDSFLDNNNLRDIVFNSDISYEELKRLFLKARLTDDLVKKLKVLLKHMKRPLAVRSSGLFEDSLMQPFAGIFETYIVPNSHPDLKVRLRQLVNAIKMVYASVFTPKARSYINAINYKIEEEKMAVVIQEVIGNTYEKYYYPHISGVAQSYNYYPYGSIEPEDGYATIALGLGTYVVEGEKAFHFCPKHPKALNFTVKDLIENTQTYFYAVNLQPKRLSLLEGENAGLSKLDIWDAERHGTLKHLASVYDIDNDRLVPGLDKAGPRVLDFADILKYDYIPLASTISTMLDIAKEAMGSPVEIEFAVDLNKDKQGRASFYLLQIKPLLGNSEDYNIELDKVDRDKLLLFTDKSMGNGKIDYLRHVVYVDPKSFDKTKTEEIALEIEQINKFMLSKGWQYILIGPGRWGTRDKWIGIPVHWGQISNSKVIVETSLVNFPLESSSGSHFFHNVISMNVGYFTIQHANSEHILRWDVLDKQKTVRKTNYVRVVEFPKPLIVKMDGKDRIALIEYDY